MKPEKKRWITALENPIEVFCSLSRILCWQLYLLQQHMLEKCSEIGLGYSDLQTGWWESGLQHDSLINQYKHCSAQLPEAWIECRLCRGREWLGCMALVCLVLGWMEQCMWEEFWKDWCYTGCEGISREDQLLITRYVQVIEQRSVFPVFLVWKWAGSLWTCQQTQVHFCVLWPAPGAALSQPLVSQGVQAGSMLPAQVRVHLSSQWVCHPHGSTQNVVWMTETTPSPEAPVLSALIPGRATFCSCRAERECLAFASKGEISAKQIESLPRACLKAEKAKDVWKQQMYGSISLSTFRILLKTHCYWVVYSELNRSVHWRSIFSYRRVLFLILKL